MAITVSSINPGNAGSEMRVDCVVSFGLYNNTGDDNTTGELLSPSILGMTGFTRVVVNQESGYQIEVLYSEAGPAVSYPTPIRFKVNQSIAGSVDGASAGTPTGSISVPLFVGNALAGHSHSAQPFLIETSTKSYRLYVDTVVGVPLVGDVMTGTLFGATGTVTNYVAGVAPDFIGYIDFTPIAGNFDNDEPVTFAPSGATGQASGVTVNVWATVPVFTGDESILAVSNDVGVGLAPTVYLPEFNCPESGYRFDPNGAWFETRNTDGWTKIYIQGVSGQGTSESGGTPTGTNGIPVFSGDAMGNHTHGLSGGAASEVPNGTDLSGPLGSVQVTCYGV